MSSTGDLPDFRSLQSSKAFVSVSSTHSAADTRPAVILGGPESLFPALLAADWQKRGVPVVVVTWSQKGSRLPPGVEVIDVARERRSLWDWTLRALEPAALRVQSHAIRRNLPHFRAATGKDQPEVWEGTMWVWLEQAWRLARAVRRLNPRFVLGCEAMAYGLPASLCREFPRAIFPFGADIYNSAETWWGADRLIGHALRKVDLVLPSSHAAADHIVQRFGVARECVQDISWGMEISPLLGATVEDRLAARTRWNIPPGAVVVANSRRFRPVWGSREVLAAALQVVSRDPQTHFILIGGPGASDEIERARNAIGVSGVENRFTLIDRELSLAEYHDLAITADIATSIMERADMRSSSVLEYAAAGAAMVIGDVPEYRHMERLGFQAQFVPCRDIAAITSAIMKAARDPELRDRARAANRTYLLAHENRTKQFDRLWSALDSLGRSAAPWRSP